MVVEYPAGASTSQEVLRGRMAVLCHAIRWIAIAWFGWSLVLTLQHWGDFDALKQGWSHYLKQDLSGLPYAHYAAAFTVVLADWAIAAGVAVMVWRLSGCYLRGSIFTTEALDELNCLGTVGVISVVADILARPLIKLALTWHLGRGARGPTLWAEPNDILHIMMALFLVALAHIFKTGVDIANDHRQII